MTAKTLCTVFQPLTFMRVTKPRASSDTVSRESVRGRTAELSKHRTLTSGGAEVVQLQAELKVCSPAERESLLSELTKGGFRVEVPVKQILGMKADLNIPSNKLREVRRYTHGHDSQQNNTMWYLFAFRWFSAWGVSFASEKRMRVRAKELIEDHLTSELGPFSFPDKEGGEEVKSAPYVYVSSLWSKVCALLDQHEK